MVVEVRLLGHRTRETRAEMQQEVKPGRTQRSKEAKTQSTHGVLVGFAVSG